MSKSKVRDPLTFCLNEIYWEAFAGRERETERERERKREKEGCWAGKIKKLWVEDEDRLS